MDNPLFSEKFRKPVPRGLVRERLETRTLPLLPAEDGPVSMGLVLGPPGSGKTTLLSHLAAAGSPIAWYRVGPEDENERTFTRHLCHALAPAVGDDSLTAAGADGRIADLISALDAGRHRAVQLIIDDVHEVSGTAAERALGTFLSLRSRDVKVILGSRRPLLVNTSRLQVSGELIELNGDDLRFRSWEVERLFRDIYDAPLSPEGAAALTRRTGGWAAGLHLFHLATVHLNRADRERAIDNLSARSRLVRSYLASTVIGSLDPERARFLLLTSTLGLLSGELCDELLGIRGSSQTLAELEAEQFFTTSTDGGATYRYHQVLQIQLETQLVAEMGDRVARELYRKSGALLERSGRIAAAVHAYARAEDWGPVCRLLAPAAAPVMADDEFLSLLSSPRAPRMDAGLILTEARLLSRRGRLAEAVRAYRRAEALIRDPQLNRACAAERNSVGLWLVPEATSGSGQRGTGPLAQLRMVTRFLGDRATDPLSHGIHLVMVGDLDAAEAQLTKDDGETGWTLLARRLAGCFLDVIRGGCETSAARVESIVGEAEVGGWPWLARVARTVQAAILVAADSITWHLASAMELLDSLARQDDRWIECLASLAIGAGFAQAGHDDLATRALARAADLAEELDAPALREWADRMAGETAAPVHGHGDAHSALPPHDPRQSRPARVVITCLGGFSLAVDAIEIGWRDLRPRARSLLMLLALRHGQLVHREELVDALWPDLTISSGIRSLQVAVSSIRHCLSPAGLSKESLRRQGDAYVLAIANAEDQLRSFELLAAQGTHEAHGEALRLRSAALELYVGDLLPEAGPAEWVVTERERLRGMAAAVASAAAANALELGEAAEALRLAQRSTEIDPYHDPSWELVIDSSARLGDLAAMATARRELARIRAELGVQAPSGKLPVRSSGHNRHHTTNVRGGHRLQKGVEPAHVDLDPAGWTENHGDTGFRIAR